MFLVRDFYTSFLLTTMIGVLVPLNDVIEEVVLFCSFLGAVVIFFQPLPSSHVLKNHKPRKEAPVLVLTRGKRVGNGWAASGQRVGNEWATRGQRVGNEWATRGQRVGNAWATSGQRVGNEWATRG
jgi:hypothetical protein